MDFSAKTLHRIKKADDPIRLTKDFPAAILRHLSQEETMFDLTTGKFCIEAGSGNETDVTLSGALRI